MEVAKAARCCNIYLINKPERKDESRGKGDGQRDKAMGEREEREE